MLYKKYMAGNKISINYSQNIIFFIDILRELFYTVHIKAQGITLKFFKKMEETKMKKNKKGFTLVELVIVVAVMAVLIAVAIPTVTSITQTAKLTVADTNARTIESTLKLAEADKSKDGDVILALSAQEIFDAIDDAKLGLTEGTYAYDAEKGVVNAVVTKADNTVTYTVKVDDYLITFGTNGLTKVAKQVAGANGTGTADSTATGDVITSHSAPAQGQGK
jgi:prepilin-type N-terminal cleavage/methylation domain-containing protein